MLLNCGSQGLVNNLISVGFGREAAFAAAVLGDNALMEKAWQDTGMLAEAVLHAHAHGRPTLRALVQAWNKTLQKEMEHGASTKIDAASAFLASLEEAKLTSLADAAKKPPIEILPPGMPSIDAPLPGIQKKTMPSLPGSLSQPPKPLQIEGPSSESAAQPPATESAQPPASESGAVPPAEGTGDPPQTTESESGVSQPAGESEVPVQPTAESGGLQTESVSEAAPDSGATPTTHSSSGSGAATTESSASAGPLENQTPDSSSINVADPVIKRNEESFNSSSSTPPPPTEAPITQKPQVPSGVREELPMIDWT